MTRFAIIGHPIGHSLSPLLHQTGFMHYGLDARYDAVDVLPEQLGATIEQFRNEQIAGFNITVPHKQHVMEFLDDISDEARVIGAVNTVSLQNGKFTGYNTDVLGVVKSLAPYQQQIQNTTCLLFGAGGASRSVMYALTQTLKPQKIFITSRTQQKSASLADSFRTSQIELEVIPNEAAAVNKALAESTLIINSTPLGMYPHTNASPLPDDAVLQPHHLVFDLVYRPLETAMLLKAQSRHATAIGGLEMLLQQGAAAFHLWTQRELPLAMVRSALLHQLSKE